MASAIPTTDVQVQWMPPEETEWMEIPNKRLSHEKATATPLD